MLSDSWQCCLDLYLQSIEDRSGSVASRRTYRSTLLQFFRSVPCPAEVSRADVLRFLASPSSSNRNKGQSVSAACKNSRRSIIASFYKFASGYEVDGRPLFQKPLPTLGLRYLKPDLQYRALSDDELLRFFAAITGNPVKVARDRALFLSYFYCARRRSELYRLTVGDIQEAIVIDPDKSRRMAHVYRFRQKGASREVRTAELPKPAYDAIVAYWHISERLGMLKASDPVFTSIHPGQGRHKGTSNVPLNADYLAREFKRYAAIAGLDPKYSLHSLRHTSARLRHEAGEDVIDIMRLLGHHDLGVTYRYLMRLTGTGDTGAKLLERRFGAL